MKSIISATILLFITVASGKKIYISQDGDCSIEGQTLVEDTDFKIMPDVKTKEDCEAKCSGESTCISYSANDETCKLFKTKVQGDSNSAGKCNVLSISSSSNEIGLIYGTPGYLSKSENALLYYQKYEEILGNCVVKEEFKEQYLSEVSTESYKINSILDEDQIQEMKDQDPLEQNKRPYQFYYCRHLCNNEKECAAFTWLAQSPNDCVLQLAPDTNLFEAGPKEQEICFIKAKRKKDDQCFSSMKNAGCDQDLRCGRPFVDDNEKQKIFEKMGEVCVSYSDCGKEKNLAGHQWVTVECRATFLAASIAAFYSVLNFII